MTVTGKCAKCGQVFTDLGDFEGHTCVTAALEARNEYSVILETLYEEHADVIDRIVDHLQTHIGEELATLASDVYGERYKNPDPETEEAIGHFLEDIEILIYSKLLNECIPALEHYDIAWEAMQRAQK